MWNREPVAIAAALQVVLVALVQLGVLDLSADQINAVYAAAAAVLALVVRSTVYAPANVVADDAWVEIPDSPSGLYDDEQED